ncbi:ATP-binding protein [Comamonas testosteroni]|uniref:histidine kinase n=1 Tax=Comamonas testosteroni (strain DSM 14576 / KF-1) TaxID=399795 RepID=B7WXE5_COMTK|nr:ATP-binding protein [Comamonas testosteroni]EED65968.1 histidine kinase [Comamonas testosteroni KF-1]WQG69352.1 ATP-binding protein [Comamonas testosteroni]
MSLQLRTVLMTGIAILALWTAAAGWMMQGVQSRLEKTLDGRLEMSARMVAALLERSSLSPSSAEDALSEAIAVTGHEGIACEIQWLQGGVMAQTIPGLQLPTTTRQPEGLSTREVNGSVWRVYVLHANGYQVTTADQLEQRAILHREMLWAAGIPLFIALLGGLAALWWGIGHGLKPLKQLSQILRDKKVDDTAPITLPHSRAELRPVVGAINAAFKRLAHALASQRSFTDAAAHELRTPLTVIDTHLQLMRSAESESETHLYLSNAETGVKRLCRTLNQMMTLAHAEAAIDPHDCCDSLQDALSSVLQRLSREQQARVKWQFLGADRGCQTPRSMVETAIRNLVDNALKYSTEDQTVEVFVQTDAEGKCYIQVTDQGSGLSEVQSQHLGRRFWRGDQNRHRNDGAGLGISIVYAITERFDGQLKFTNKQGGGLVVELLLK